MCVSAGLNFTYFQENWPHFTSDSSRKFRLYIWASQIFMVVRPMIDLKMTCSSIPKVSYESGILAHMLYGSSTVNYLEACNLQCIDPTFTFSPRTFQITQLVLDHVGPMQFVSFNRWENYIFVKIIKYSVFQFNQSFTQQLLK